MLGAKGLPRGPCAYHAFVAWTSANLGADYDSRRHEAGMSLDGMRDQALHAVRRRPWARGMNSASMKYYEELIRETLGDLIVALKQRTGRPIDMSEWTNFFGFDFMGRMA